MNRQTAEEIIKGDLEGYLQRKGIDTRKNFKCLNPAHTDSNPSMSYDRKRNKCHCFSCGADYSTLDVIGIDYGITQTGDIYRKAYELYGLNTGGSGSAAEEDFKKVNVNTGKPEEKQKTEDLLPYYRQCAEDLQRSGYSYTSFRGISEATAKKYMLGLERHFNRGTGGAVWEALIIPTSRNTYTARNTDPEAGKRDRVRKAGSSVLFNPKALNEAQSPVFIVEGELDALSIIEAGGEAVGLGSTSNCNRLLKYLKEFKPDQPLIVALDNDEEGQKKADELSEGLTELQIPFYRTDPYMGCKDANEALTTNREAFKREIARALEDIERIHKQELQEQRDEYRKTSAAFYIQDFMGEIADSVNTRAIPTGFPGLDGVLDGGLYKGLYLCGAISSLGKTTLIMQIADQIAQAGNDVLIFSLEMARSELMAKSISRLTLLDTIRNNGSINHAKTARGITSGDRYRNYSREEKDLIQRAIQAYSEYAQNIFISEGIGNIGTNEIRETIKQHIRITGRKPVVIIDYIQVLAPADIRATDKQNTDKAVLELKRISRDCELPIIGISSLNRANYHTPISMEALKESGSLEYGSDVIFGLQLKGAGDSKFNVNEAKARNPREIELIILKNRNGATGGKLRFEYYPMFNYFKEVK